MVNVASLIRPTLVATALSLAAVAVAAQDIMVPEAEWNELSAEDRQQIETILRSSKLLPEGAAIEPGAPEAAAAAPEGDVQPQLFGLPEGICRAGCDALAGVALAACTGLTSGTAVVVCSGAAQSGRDLCKRTC